MSEREPSMPTLALVVRAVVYAACAAAFAFPLAHASSLVATSAGAVLGLFVGVTCSRTPLRLPTGIALAAAWLGFVHLLCVLLLDSASLARSLGPAELFGWVDALRFGGFALGLASLLSLCSTRVRALGVLELAVAGSALARLVFEHRHGAIHRPFEIADPMLARGEDPTVLFFALGIVTAALLAGLLVVERRISRLALHSLFVVLLLWGTWIVGNAGTLLPRPVPASSGLGLTGKPPKEPLQGKKGGGAGQGKKPSADELEFRDEQSRDEHQTPVAVVLLHDDYSPPAGIYYFRQGAFSQFNGRRLVTTTRPDADRDIAQSFALSKTDVLDAPDSGSLRATLDTTVALVAEHTRPFGLEAPVVFEPASNPNPDRFQRVYRVTSAALTADYATLVGFSAGAAAWSADVRKHYTQVPDDPRYKALADTIMNGMPVELRSDPLLAAWTVRDWLAENGTYSLKSKHASATDPTADFLFGDKHGYCVHFAHAGVYLMRALGLPARVATGYAVAESARQGGSALLVTAGNAHAWPEVYLDGLGWVVFDPQPERALDPPVQPPDPELQRLLGELARGARPLPPDGSAPQEPWERWVRALARQLARSVGLVLLGVLALLYVAKCWRRVCPWVASKRQLPRVLYRAELDRLADIGIVRSKGESREAFAARHARELPSLGLLTRANVAAKFGSRAVPEAPALSGAARTLARERRAFVPLGRRLLGFVSPFGFLRSR